MRVAVIGSGLGGLSAACTLAARGYQVEVFEKNPWLGGKAAVLQEEGFRFDMGPTILIQPSVLRRIFCEAGRTMSDYLEMVRLDPQWRCFFDDGTVLDLKDDVHEMAASLEGREPELGTRFSEFMALSERLHNISDKFFFWKSVGSMRDTFDIGGSFQIGVLKDVLSMRLGQSVSGTIRELIKDPRVAQMLDHYVQYVGSSPDNSPAILCSIGHMQAEQGIWYPKGGTRAVPQALVRLGTELGVRYHTSIEIARLLTDGSVFERALTPVDIHQRYKVLNGAIYGISSHGRWSGAFKPANASPDLEGLYLAGGAAHPGPGMPMVMMSGWIAADALDQRYRGAEAAISARLRAEELLAHA
jgi:diapolycopene oxygenase